MLSPDPRLPTLLFSWQTSWESFVVLALQLAALAWYLGSVRRLATAGQHWSVWVATSFVLGVVVSAYAYEGGVAYYQRSNFTAHVVQLLLLCFAAPPLVAGGCPLRLALLSGTGRPTRSPGCSCSPPPCTRTFCRLFTGSPSGTCSSWLTSTSSTSFRGRFFGGQSWGGTRRRGRRALAGGFPWWWRRYLWSASVASRWRA